MRLKRTSWARLIKKLYLEDPTLCPACRQPMKIISVITHPHQDDVIEKILRSRGNHKSVPLPLKATAGYEPIPNKPETVRPCWKVPA